MGHERAQVGHERAQVGHERAQVGHERARGHERAYKQTPSTFLNKCLARTSLSTLQGGDHRFTAKWRAVLRIPKGSFSRSFDFQKESSWIEALRRVHQEVWDQWQTYKDKEGFLPDCFPFFFWGVSQSMIAFIDPGKL